MNDYRSSSGGRWFKQYYTVTIGNDPDVWGDNDYDWIWLENGIKIYEMDAFLQVWTNSYMTFESIYRAHHWIFQQVIPYPYNLPYIYQKSRSGGAWDLKPLMHDPRHSLYKFKSDYYLYDSIANIGWGRIMAAHGIDPLTAMGGAGLFQMYEVWQGDIKPVNFPFGDDIRDTRAILRGYWWFLSGR